jgi:dTDP-L-oleandrosyltransferase
VARIAVITTALGGHARPAIRVARALVANGHAVHVWADEWFRAMAEPTGTTFHPYNPMSYPWPLGGLGFAAALAQGTEETVEDLIGDLLREEIELVIHDVHALWGRVAAQFLELPRIASNPMFPPSPAFPSFEGWAARRSRPRPAEAERMLADARDAIRRKWRIEVDDWPSVMVQRAPLTLSFTTEEITGGIQLPSGWRYVGPLMEPKPTSVPSGRLPLVYVAFGTYFNHRGDFFKLAADAVAGESVHALIAAGQALGARRPELEPLPPNVELHGVVASQEVLSRATVHITHGGGGSVHESLLAGVPMICLPQGSDHRAWSTRVEELGAGRIVHPDPRALREALRQLLEDSESHARAAAIGQRLRFHDGHRALQAVVAEALAGQLV